MARIVVPGVPHHVTQRGNNRQDVFFVDDDHRVYLGLLAEQCRRFGLSVVCYCLMTNHVHLVVIPKHVDSLAKGIGRTNLLYSQYIGRLHRRTGHLWQNRFFSCSLDDEHLVHACCYVERNPLRARMVRLPRAVPKLSLMATRASAGGWTVCELRLIGRVRGFWHGRVVGCSAFLPGRLTSLLCSPRR